MPRYRNALPQLSGDMFLTDAGLETDLIFNHGVEIPAFAAHTLLPSIEGRAAIGRYFEGFLDLAGKSNAGFILDSATWKAHRHWARELNSDPVELRAANQESIGFISELRDRFSHNAKPIVLNAIIGPCGDAYRPEAAISTDQAEAYHAEQLGWIADTEADMVTAVTFNQASEAAGLVRAARSAGLPAAVSFTVETDGALPNGQSLADAITEVDEASNCYPAYFMINCAHPEHFSKVLGDSPWARRIRGVRANASRKSHAELDEAPELDAGDPVEMAGQYRELEQRMPWLNIFGGCCGTDLRHVKAIAGAVRPR
ncbi:MAG: homocysteine S-methyltransferase family protein [Actinomycetota bacterium]